MPSFGERSRERLATCDTRLQDLFNEVIKRFDVTVLCGYRTEEEQNKHYAEGRSKLRYPKSKHNRNPSKAIDVAPWPIAWDDRERFHLMAGYVLGIASQMDIPLRWGGDWDGDTEVRDNTFDDLVHFEIKE